MKSYIPFLLSTLVAAIPTPSDVPRTNIHVGGARVSSTDEGYFKISFEDEIESKSASPSQREGAEEYEEGYNSQLEESQQDGHDSEAEAEPANSPTEEETIVVASESEQTTTIVEPPPTPTLLPIRPPPLRSSREAINTARLQIDSLAKKMEEVLLEYIRPDMTPFAWIRRSRLRRESRNLAQQLHDMMKELGKRTGINVLETGACTNSENDNTTPQWRNPEKISNGLRDEVYQSMKNAAGSLHMTRKLNGQCDKTSQATGSVDYKDMLVFLAKRIDEVESLQAMLYFRGEGEDLGPGKNKRWTRNYARKEYVRRVIKGIFTQRPIPGLDVVGNTDDLHRLNSISEMWKAAAKEEMLLVGKRAGGSLYDWVGRVDKARQRFFMAVHDLSGSKNKMGMGEEYRYEMEMYGPKDEEYSESDLEEEVQENNTADEPKKDELVDEIDERFKIYNERMREQREFPADPLKDLISVSESIQNKFTTKRLNKPTTKYQDKLTTKHQVGAEGQARNVDGAGARRPSQQGQGQVFTTNPLGDLLSAGGKIYDGVSAYLSRPKGQQGSGPARADAEPDTRDTN